MPLLPDDLSFAPKVSWDQKDVAIVLDPSMIPPEHDNNYPIIGGIAVSRILLGLAENSIRKNVVYVMPIRIPTRKIDFVDKSTLLMLLVYTEVELIKVCIFPKKLSKIPGVRLRLAC